MEESVEAEEFAYDTVATSEAGGAAAETPEPDDSVADYTAKIIYTASVSIETTEFDKAVAALENQVQKIGGFVESSNVTGDTQYNSDGTTTVVNRWAYYTVRIPCDHFESFLHETEGFGNVTSTSRDAQNVTSAYTDYEARLSSLNTQEERLLDMLAKSEDVETLIALEQRLSDVRYEIESIERNLRNYDMQIKYSTVNLDLREVEVYTPTVPVRRTFSQKLADLLCVGQLLLAIGELLLCVGQFLILFIERGLGLVELFLVFADLSVGLLQPVAEFLAACVELRLRRVDLLLRRVKLRSGSFDLLQPGLDLRELRLQLRFLVL